MPPDARHIAVTEARKLREEVARLRGELATTRATMGLVGKSQALAARQVGIDAATWNRIENDRLRQVDFQLVGRMAAVVGLDFTVGFYPAPRRLHDGTQLELLADTRFISDRPPLHCVRPVRTRSQPQRCTLRRQCEAMTLHKHVTRR